jgi:hypothetical protein
MEIFMSDQNKIVSNEELLVSNMLEIQSLIRILVRKGITTEDEILEEVKALKVEMDEKIRKMGREN